MILFANIFSRIMSSIGVSQCFSKLNLNFCFQRSLYFIIKYETVPTDQLKIFNIRTQIAVSFSNLNWFLQQAKILNKMFSNRFNDITALSILLNHTL